MYDFSFEICSIITEINFIKNGEKPHIKFKIKISQKLLMICLHFRLFLSNRMNQLEQSTKNYLEIFSLNGDMLKFQSTNLKILSVIKKEIRVLKFTFLLHNENNNIVYSALEVLIFFTHYFYLVSKIFCNFSKKDFSVC